MTDMPGIDEMFDTVQELVRSASACARDPLELEKALIKLETYLTAHFSTEDPAFVDSLTAAHRQQLAATLAEVARLEAGVTAKLAWLDSLNQHLIDSLEEGGPE